MRRYALLLCLQIEVIEKCYNSVNSICNCYLSTGLCHRNRYSMGREIRSKVISSIIGLNDILHNVQTILCVYHMYHVDYSYQAEHEKSQLTTNLKESQEGLEKTRQELDAQHARVSHLLGHISALVKLHDQENPSQVRRLLLDCLENLLC